MRQTAPYLASYLAPWILQRLHDDPRPPTKPSVDDVAAAVLFVDVSGFTPLAERLGEQGVVGAEHLSRALNAYFAPAIDVIAEDGGQVVDFAGDALIAAWFAVEGGEPLAACARRAAGCALRLRDRLNDHEVAAGIRLSMKAGLAAGTVRVCSVGGAEGRWRFLMAGTPVREMSAAERRAGDGDVVVTAAAWRLLEPCARAHVLPDGHARLERIVGELGPRAEATRAPPPEAETALRAYVPEPVLVNLDAGHADWLAELRKVSVAFVSVQGIDAESSELLDRLQAVTQAATGAVARMGGVVHQFVADDKGTTLVAAWGLPGSRHEDDALRALEAGLGVQEALAERGIGAAIGIATGRVFCGDRGSERRREYAMVGKTVNLAARLSQVADAGVLCDRATHDAASARGAGGRLTFQSLPPFVLKGSGEPVPVHRVGRAERAPARATLVGRESERAALFACLDAIAAPRDDGGASASSARVIVIEGEPGIGKSRLVDDVRRAALARSIGCLVGASSPTETSTAYHAWRAVFRTLLELDGPEGDTERQRRRVRARLAALGDGLEDLAPLLNPVTLLDFPETALTEQMQGEARADSTNRVLARLLADDPLDANGAPRRLVCLEDAHWFDSSTWALVREVARTVRCVVLVLTTRLPGERPAREYRELQQSPDALWIRPTPLGHHDTAQLLRKRLAVAAVAEDVVDLVHARSGGNPFFAEELAHALRDSGLLVARDGVCRLVSDRGDVRKLVPDSVESTIAARIDQLSPRLQMTLKVASVLGRSFSVRGLEDVYPVAADRASVPEALAQLERFDLLVAEADAPEPRHAFKHAITQEVAYGLLLFAQRRDLHRSVAEWYERRHADNVAPFYPLLAHHWTQAAVEPKAIEYLDKAGLQALDADANAEALRLLAEARALDDGGPAIRHARRVQAMAQALYRLGRLGESEEHCRRALALLVQPVPGSAAGLVRRALGSVVDQMSRRLVPEPLWRGRDGEREDALLSYRTHRLLSYCGFINNNTNLTLYASLKCVEVAERLGPSPELALAYATLSPGCGAVRLHAAARSYQRRALELIRRLQPETTLASAQALEAICVYTSGVGDWDGTRAGLDEAIAFFARIGEWTEWGLSMQMLGRWAVHRGHFAELGTIADALEASARRRDAVVELSWALNDRAESVLHSSDDLPHVIALCRRSLDLLQGTDCWSAIAIAESLLAVAEARAGRTTAAWEAAQRALAMIRRTQPTSFGQLVAYAGTAAALLAVWEAKGADAALRADATAACRELARLARNFPIARPASGRHDGLRQWLLGRHAKAERLWRRAIRHAEALDMPYEVAAAHLELGRHLAGAPAVQHLERAAAIFGELHVEHDRRRALSALDTAPRLAGSLARPRVGW